MLMSTIVDGGLYRESTFMLQGLFSPELIANRNCFVLTVGAIMVGVACLSMAMGVLAARCSAIATQGFARNMRGTLLGKIESFSFANIDHISTPQLITRATTDINTLRDTMRQSLVTLYRAPVMVILATVMSFIVSPGLAPLLLICIPPAGGADGDPAEGGPAPLQADAEDDGRHEPGRPGESGGQPGGEGLRPGRLRVQAL